MYVGRVHSGNRVIPCGVSVTQDKVSYTDGIQMLTAIKHEMLAIPTTGRIYLSAMTGLVLPSNVVEGGLSSNGDPLYVIRSTLDSDLNAVIAGYYDPINEMAHIVHQGTIYNLTGNMEMLLYSEYSIVLAFAMSVL